MIDILAHSLTARFNKFLKGIVSSSVLYSNSCHLMNIILHIINITNEQVDISEPGEL